MEPWLWNQQQFWMGFNNMPQQVNLNQPRQMNGQHFQTMQYPNQQPRPFFPRRMINRPRMHQQEQPSRRQQRREQYHERQCQTSYNYEQLQIARNALHTFIGPGASRYWNQMQGGGPNVWEGMAGMMEHITEGYPLPEQGKTTPEASICDPALFDDDESHCTGPSIFPVSNPEDVNSINNAKNTNVHSAAKKAKTADSTIVFVSDDDSGDDVEIISPLKPKVDDSKLSLKIGNKKSPMSESKNSTPPSVKKSKKVKKKLGKSSKTSTDTESDANSSSVLLSIRSLMDGTYPDGDQADSPKIKDHNHKSPKSMANTTDSVLIYPTIIKGKKKKPKKKKNVKKLNNSLNASSNTSDVVDDSESDILEAIEPGTRESKVMTMSQFKNSNTSDVVDDSESDILVAIEPGTRESKVVTMSQFKNEIS